ncbi:MAG: diaminopimelate decarboxylase [Atopobiaceae bacterium]|nr:diaminopimelate decarboxylase [Atopobiaceae bacterium]MDO4405376.1 diaminopimelate decarboxylase [Atopobiaceae bacterium]
MLYPNLSTNAAGHLCIAGIDACDLAATYGTPLYVLDEDRIREKCRIYVQAMQRYLPKGSYPLYAGKALCFRGIYPVVQSEGLGADVVSAGEIATALSAGFPASKLFFHGSNKTDAEIAYGVSQGVGHFVVDNTDELQALSREAQSRGITQRVLLRVTVGLDPHTLAAISTGKVDSQFGVPIETGQAERFVAEALQTPGVQVDGFHSHIGSQIFEASSFCDQIDRLLAFACDVRDKLGYVANTLNLGGGFAVPYVVSDETVDIDANIKAIAEHLAHGCEQADYPLPCILMEPGRSIVADAGVTLYSAGRIKTVEGYRSYVMVDGGMTDNPRYALYKSAYTVINASHACAPADFECTIAGRCCESGDRIAEDIRIARPERGDILAVLTTGAYNFAMSSNYNRVPRPALVMLHNGEARLAVRRQTIEDLLSLEI